jgi:hypothetical protein
VARELESRASGESDVYMEPESEFTTSTQQSHLRPLPTTLLIAELCGLGLLGWPLIYNFNRFAFLDAGGYLVTHYLLQRGYLPVTDFGWQYGLLPLLLQELWFHIVPASPASFLILSFSCALALTIVIGKFVNIESKATGRALVLLTLPFVVWLGGDPPHALEPVLLSAGLLMHAKGKREQALAFATAACFAKPVMAYLYGLILLIFIVVDLRRQRNLGTAALARAAAPAALTGLSLALLLGIAFGPIVLLSSLLPLTGSHAYRALHFGWSGTGLGLFYFPGVRPTYYFGTPVTFWLCATLYLIAAVPLRGWRMLRSRIPAPGNYEIALTCFLLHLGFVGLFYGAPASWTNYAYILVMGVAATDAWSAANSRLVWGLCILAAIGNYGEFKSSLVAWKTMKQSSVTAGLFAPPAEAAEWDHVTSLVKAQNPALFTWLGAAEVMFPWLRKPVGAFFVPGVASNSEIQHKVQQLRSAKAVIIPTIPEFAIPVMNWPGPEFQTVLDNATPVFKGSYFEVYERPADAGATSEVR